MKPHLGSGENSPRKSNVYYCMQLLRCEGTRKGSLSEGFPLEDEDCQSIEPDVEWEFHCQYLTQNSYKISGEEGEPEPVITPPPPTAPELEDPLIFDPKVTGIWDEQKAQLKESAKSEQVTPSFRHVTSTLREASPFSEGAKSRGPSRKNPLYLGRIAIAAHKAKAFVQFQDLQNTILPCDEREAVALFSGPPWIQRITACTTSDEVIQALRLYHQQCWSDEHKNTTDLLMQTDRATTRYKKIRRRLKYMDVYAAQHIIQLNLKKMMPFPRKMNLLYCQQNLSCLSIGMLSQETSS